MDVYWYEQTEANVPLNDDWMTSNELTRFSALRFPKRRADWRLGRWTAKRAVALYLTKVDEARPLIDFEIRSADDGAPEVLLKHRPDAPCISLSHRDGIALCTVSAPPAAMGCDIEVIESRSDNFITDYFTSGEQDLVAQTPATYQPQVVTLIWSAKESALKALRTGLRSDTRSVEVSLGQLSTEHNEREPTGLSFDHFHVAKWRPFNVLCFDGQFFSGWWQRKENYIQTLVAKPSPAVPCFLQD